MAHDFENKVNVREHGENTAKQILSLYNSKYAELKSAKKDDEIADLKAAKSKADIDLMTAYREGNWEKFNQILEDFKTSVNDIGKDNKQDNLEQELDSDKKSLNEPDDGIR